MSSEKDFFYYYFDSNGEIHYMKAIPRKKVTRNLFTDMIFNTNTEKCEICGRTRYTQHCYFCLDNEVIEVSCEEISKLVKQKISKLEEQINENEKVMKIKKLLNILNY